MRSWCARICWHGLEELLFGTVWTGRGDGEEQARILLEKAMQNCFPTKPEILAIVPGAIVFHDETEYRLPYATALGDK